MGIETAILVGLSVASAISSISTANKAGKATIREGEIVAANKAKEVKYKAAQLTSSFLNSGLTLEGTPYNVIDSTFNTGLEDIAQITSNYNMKAKSQISEGRSKALSTIVSGFGSYAIGGGFGNISSSVGTLSGGSQAMETFAPDVNINNLSSSFDQPTTLSPLNWLGRNWK